MSDPICTAKFKLISRVENQAGFTLTFEPVTSGSEENDRFFKYTPWGKLEIGTINAAAANAFIVGGEYILPFIPAA